MSMICMLLFLLCYFTFPQNRQEMHIWLLERRWVALSVDFHMANVPNVIGSCIVLHSIWETHRDCYSDEWDG